MTRPPVVSVVMPTFNRLAFVVETVRSVQAQTFQDWELIVVDDGSTDETLAALAALGDPRIRCFALPHSGNLGRLRNFGVRQAAAPYIAFQDSDDLWLPHKLETQLRRLRERPGRRWCYASFRLIDAAGRPYPTGDPAFGRVRGTPDGLWRRLLAHEEIVIAQGLLVERSLLDEIGGLDDSLKLAVDFDLAVRLARSSPDAAAVEEPLVLLRRHPHAGEPVDVTLVADGLTQAFGRYMREAAAAGDEETRSLCRRQLARHALDLAALDIHVRRPHAGLRALGTALRAGAAPSKVLRVVMVGGVRYLLAEARALRARGERLQERARAEGGSAAHRGAPGASV